MFRRLRERMAHRAALKVLKHAAVTRYAGIPAQEITALQALAWWYESKVERNTFARFTQLQSLVPGPPIFDRSGDQIHPRGDTLEVLDDVLVEEQRLSDVALHPRIPAR